MTDNKIIKDMLIDGFYIVDGVAYTGVSDDGKNWVDGVEVKKANFSSKSRGGRGRF